MRPASVIDAIDAIEVLDCRGHPTVRVYVASGSCRAYADVPAGLSTGVGEAKELRDGEARYGGRGVRKAVANVVDVIGPALVGKSVFDQRAIDLAMLDLDGTPDKSTLGGNAILGVSLAVARVAALSLDQPLYRYLNPNGHVLPVPLVNLINGGKHASNDLDFQEFCIFPVGAKSFAESMEISYAVNAVLRDMVIDKYGKIAANVGDEGGFAPPIVDVREAMDLLVAAVEKSGEADKIVYGLDCATSHLYDAKSGKYTIGGNTYSTEQLLEFYRKLIADYPLVSMEDPFSEHDTEGFVAATRELGIQIVGDDFFCTNPKLIAKGAEQGAANAVLWKVNQIGTLTEALTASEFAYRERYAVMVSERSGETEDPIIADLVVAINSGQIKTGAPVRGERTAKYNRLLEIERELGSRARYAGRHYRNPAAL